MPDTFFAGSIDQIDKRNKLHYKNKSAIAKRLATAAANEGIALSCTLTMLITSIC